MITLGVQGITAETAAAKNTAASAEAAKAGNKDRTGTAKSAVSGNVEEMTVDFIDVGQGDSTLITCGGESMLIDAGDTDKGTTVQLYLSKHKVKELKYLVLTHPDSDHIGGAPVIITKFSIGKAYVSNFTKTNRIYENLMQAFEYKDLKPAVPESGSICTLGTATITFLAPNKVYDNPNDSSVALIIKDGNKKFLFTGDAESDAEKDIIATGIDISADVYQVGHHGSKTSSSQALLDAVNPSAAVISCGEGNKYGHPDAETLSRFRAAGIEVYRTDEEGSIEATTDGKTIKWNVPSSTTWQAGEAAGSATVTAPAASSTASAAPTAGTTYVVNKNSKKFHLPTCSSVTKISAKNRMDVTCSRDELLSQGYVPCKICNP